MTKLPKITHTQIESAMVECKHRIGIIESIVTPDILTTSESDRKKKEEELSALKNFIASYDSSITIVESREKPDFHIISNGKNIGVELTVLPPNTKQTRVIYIEKLFKKVEEILRERFPSHTRLIYCFIKDDLVVLKNDISEYSVQIADLLSDEVQILETLSYKYYRNNKFFNRTQSINHHQLNVMPNFGVNYAYDADINEINEIVKKKNNKGYNTEGAFDEIWLIIYVYYSDRMGRRTLEDIVLEDKDRLIYNDFDKVFVYNQHGKCCCLK